MPKSSSARDKEERILNALRMLPNATGTIADIHQAAADGTVVETFYRPVRRLLHKQLIHKVGFDYQRNADLYAPIDVRPAERQLSLFDIEVDREEVASQVLGDKLDFGEDIVGQNAAYAARSVLYEDNRRTVLKKVFELWREEEPRRLIFRYIEWLASQFRQTSERYNVAFGREREQLRQKADKLAKDILEFGNRGLGIHADYLSSKLSRDGFYTLEYHPENIREHIEKTVFGEHMIDEIQLTPEQMNEASDDMVVVGTDSPMHVGEVNMGLSSFAEDEMMPLTVNNGAAFWRYASNMHRIGEEEKSRDMLPWDPRQMEGPPNENTKFMVVGPEVFEDAGQDKYTRIAVSASEIIQRRVDERSIRHPERRTPDIVFHDGRIYPMEHKLNNFLDEGEYGDTVRSAIRHFYNILVQITGRKRKSPLYVGVVKSTELKIFGRLLDWYIRYDMPSSNEKVSLGEDWPETPPFPDTSAMTYLLSLGGYEPETGKFFTTCQIRRDFATLAGYYDKHQDSRPIADWERYFQNEKQKRLRDHEPGDPLPPILTLDIDPFVELCERAGVLMFFINHTQNSTDAPRLPRYEIFCDITSPEGNEPQRVRQQVERVLQGLILAQVQPDKDHDLAASIGVAGKQNAIMIPVVLYEAHETAKEAGKDFEAQFRAAVFTRLVRTLKAQASKIVINPTTRDQFIELMEKQRSSRMLNSGKDKEQEDRYH